MLEALLEILAEFLLQAIGEALVEIGLHSLAAPFRKAPNPWLAAIGYLLFGAILGGLGLIFFPSHLIASKALRVVNVIITPLALGMVMSSIGAWRLRRGQQLLRIDRFTYGYLFALAVALVRLWFAK